MPSTTRSTLRFGLLVHFAFFLTGIATVLIGQVLPIISRRFALDDLQAGYFFPAQFAGSIAGTVLSTWFSRAGRLPEATALGCLAMAGGIGLMAAPGFELCLAGFLLNGIGIGLILPSANLLVIETHEGNTASALAVMNFCWGVGAIVSKPFVDAFAGDVEFRAVSLLLALPLAIAGILIHFGRPGQIRKSGEADDIAEGHIPIWRRPLAWAIAAFNFVHLGFESGMGGWLTTYAERVDPAGGTFYGISPTVVFFLMFVAGRGIAPAMLRMVSVDRLLTVSLATVAAGALITVVADSMQGLIVGAAISGLGTSAIFPTNVSRFSTRLGPEAARNATPFFVSGTLGAAVVTWLIGFVSNSTGSLQSGMYMLAGAAGVLIALHIAIILTAGPSSDTRLQDRVSEDTREGHHQDRHA
jgi:fucose permease